MGQCGATRTKARRSPPNFQHALMQQVMRTELIRVKALIGTTAILAVLLLIIHTVDPYAVEHPVGTAASRLPISIPY